jgi:hypothetical protein
LVMTIGLPLGSTLALPTHQDMRDWPPWRSVPSASLRSAVGKLPALGNAKNLVVPRNSLVCKSVNHRTNPERIQSDRMQSAGVVDLLCQTDDLLDILAEAIADHQFICLCEIPTQRRFSLFLRLSATTQKSPPSIPPIHFPYDRLCDGPSGQGAQSTAQRYEESNHPPN